MYQEGRFYRKKLDTIVNRITSDKKTWLSLMMKEELGLFEERFEKPVKVGFIMLIAFIAGGLVTIMPFLLMLASQFSLIVASIVTFASLFLIGVWKTTFTSKHWLLSGLEMVFVGVLAAVIPYLIGDILLSSVLSQFVH
jgi:predicted membrane protein (TIGR00267 family)